MPLRSGWAVVAALCMLAASVYACQTAKRVIIFVDGERRVVETEAATVDDVLREQKIQVGENDLVTPPGYTPLERAATIQIVRVEFTTVKTDMPAEFARRVTRDESLPEGTLRVIQLGANGVAEVTYQITLEDHQPVSRREISRTVITPPRDEILVQGTQNSLAPVKFQGTLLYLAHGNAWVMRTASNDKRPLTFEGDLDGRVFDLSPDGRFLLFTRAGTTNLNSLWLADTAILDEKPRRVPLDDLLYAEWAADGSPRIAYSTGEKTPGAPGWKAHGDLNVATLTGISETLAISTTTATVPLTGTAAITVSGTTSLTIAATTPISISTRQIISPSIPAPYAWWGGRLAWTPDTRAFALGLANQVRLVNAPDGLSRVLKPFAFYDTHADWVWTPQFAWSPDSRFLAVTVHAAPEGAGLPEDSPTFDLWILSRDNSVDLALVHNTGMWSFPTWSPRDASGESKIAYGAALNASDSERSSYALDVMNRDGSNRRQIYPTGTTGAPGGEPGLEVVQVAWSPDAAQLVAVRAGDLWLYDFSTNLWSQLTANGDTRLPQWK